MNETKELRTFVISHKGKIISPVLTTTREYGRWMLLTFDGYTCEKELHLYSNKDGLMTLGSFYDWVSEAGAGVLKYLNVGIFTELPGFLRRIIQ